MSRFRLLCAVRSCSALAVIASLAGCSGQSGGRTGAPNVPSRIRVRPEALDATIRRAESRLEGLTGDADLLDALYFTWVDRPYQRATLGVALKTLAVLKREQAMRRSDNGAMTDADLARVLRWLDGTLERLPAEPSRPGFHPQRVRADGQARAAAPRFALLDRASATRRASSAGEFDLLACLGFGAYAVPARSTRSDDAGLVAERASAIGCGLYRVMLDESEAAQPCIQPRPLAWWLQQAGGDTGLAENQAGIDPPDAESVGESVARRRLIRAMAGDQRVTVTGWTPPDLAGIGSDRASATRREAEQFPLGMWLHAVNGQSLGIIEGWRDLRDGSRSRRPAMTVRPWEVETLAHTALDLLFFRDAIHELGDVPRPVAVIVDAAAAGPKDENRWSPECAAVFRWLLDQQLGFDVLPARLAASAGRLDGYRGVIVLTKTPAPAALIETLKAVDGRGAGVIPSPGETCWDRMESLTGLSAADVERLRASGQPRLLERSGEMARGCAIVANDSWIVLMNLEPRRRQLRLDLKQPHGNLKDARSAERLPSGPPIAVEPLGFRVLSLVR